VNVSWTDIDAKVAESVLELLKKSFPAIELALSWSKSAAQVRNAEHCSAVQYLNTSPRSWKTDSFLATPPPKLPRIFFIGLCEV
jgi:hypothetical protein